MKAVAVELWFETLNSNSPWAVANRVFLTAISHLIGLRSELDLPISVDLFLAEPTHPNSSKRQGIQTRLNF